MYKPGEASHQLPFRRFQVSPLGIGDLCIVVAIYDRLHRARRSVCRVDFDFLRPTAVPSTPPKPIPRSRALQRDVACHLVNLIWPNVCERECMFRLKDVASVARYLRFLQLMLGCRQRINANGYILHREGTDNRNLKTRNSRAVMAHIPDKTMPVSACSVTSQVGSDKFQSGQNCLLFFDNRGVVSTISNRLPGTKTVSKECTPIEQLEEICRQLVEYRLTKGAVQSCVATVILPQGRSERTNCR